MTALEMMKWKLRNVYIEQLTCINAPGYIVYPGKYKRLVKQAKAYKQAIDYLIQEE